MKRISSQRIAIAVILVVAIAGCWLVAYNELQTSYSSVMIKAGWLDLFGTYLGAILFVNLVGILVFHKVKWFVVVMIILSIPPLLVIIGPGY